jgi:2-oxoglutarate ferredoxin oxidoreductase subunit alpha
MDHSIKIGGEAGQGIQTVGGLLASVFARAGLHVFTHQDYESRVRGGHNFYQVRVSDSRVMSSLERVDIIVALDKESIGLHRTELGEGGVLAYDSEALKHRIEDDPRAVDIPFLRLAREEGGNPVMANTVATGAVLGMLGLDVGLLEGLLGEIFKKKGAEVVEGNRRAARAGHSYAREHCGGCRFEQGRQGRPKKVLDGAEAVALGALASGLKFYSAYPMTPSTGIMNNIAARAREYGIVVEQAEDEISAMNMALGASFAGVRAMTGTSGGGFALMVEGLSLAGMTETPIVIAEAQRPGPATGLPTRTEQADLLFVLHAGHGEFPRVVFAPGSPSQAVFLTNKAFDLSEKYQVPAFVMTDQYLGDSQWTYDSLDPAGLVYKDYRIRAGEFGKLNEYRRHAYTDSGVSPLAVPGEGPHTVVTDSDEHDEEGHIVEDAETRVKMVEKRFLKKLPQIKEEMSPPMLFGAEKPETIVVCWGSNYGVVREAVERLTAGGKSIAMMHFSEVWPLPGTESVDWMCELAAAKRSICLENNAGGQFARLIRMETGYSFDEKINKFDGRPFLLDEVVERISG